MIYKLSSICGQEQLKQQLANLWQNNAHAVLITGEKGSGRKLAGRVLASAYLCQEITSSGGCGQCKACKTFAEGNHPDYSEVVSHDGKRIKIQSLRDEVIAKLAIKPQVTDRKVFLIDLAKIDEAAQNVLLKSLEEPPAFVRFILIAEKPQQVLPTVLSRCTLLRTSPLTEAEMRVAMSLHLPEELSPEQLAFLQQYSGGNVGRALEIYHDADFSELRTESCAWFVRLTRASKAELLIDGYKFFVEQRSNLEVILNIWQSLWRDLVLLYKNQPSLMINRDQEVNLRSMLTDVHLKDIRLIELLDQQFQALKDLRRQLQVNVTYEHAISNYLLQAQRLVKNRK